MAHSGKMITFATDLLPNEDNIYYLGADNQRWKVPGAIFTDKLITTKPINQIVTGTGTAASNAGSGANQYKPAKWTFNLGSAAPTDGDIVTIKIPVAGHDYGVFMSTNNGANYYPVVCNGTGRLTTHYPVNTYITVVFESTGSAASMFAVEGGTSRVTISGGVWRVINYYDSNSNDTGYYHRRIYPNLKAGTGGIDKYVIIMQLADGRWSGIVPQSQDTASNGTVTPRATSKTASSNSFVLGHVLIMYANATYAENANVATYNIWSAHTGLIDARYSFNLENIDGKRLVGYKPVYIVGTMNNGLFKLDSTQWWSQTLPSSDDGKIYIYIGDAYDWYRLTFTEDKPIYWYKDGAVRLYSGASEYALNAGTVNGHTVAVDVPSGAKFTDTTSFTITAAATDGLWDLTGTNGTNKVTYALAPFSTKQSAASFYTAATNPTLTTRLNYDGYLYATKLYSGGSEVLTSHRTYTAVSGKKPTGNQTPGFGNTFDIEQVGQDATGQVSVTERTVTIPNTSASTTTAGLVDTSAQTFTGVKTFDSGIHIYGTIDMAGTAAGKMQNGGAYHGGHNSIVLHGDSAGVSGIGFTSQKATNSSTITNINSGSDRAFIQYHAYGITPAAEGTAPTLAASGEAGRLVIGIGNDSGDKILLQAPGDTDIVHQKGSTGYPIPHTTNTNGSVGGTTTPVYVEAGVIKAGTALGTASQKAESYFVKAVTSTDNAIVRFDSTSGQVQDSTTTINDTGTMTIKGKLIVNPSYDTSNSYNEGIRINQASNGWANIHFGGAKDTTSAAADGAWLVGRRGAAGSKNGAIGDFTIEEQGSDGGGLTLKKDYGGAILYTSLAGGSTSFTITNAGTVAASTYYAAIRAYSASMTATSFNIISLGHSATSKNSGWLGFYYAGSSNDGNYLALGIHSVVPTVKLYATGQFHISTDTDSSSTTTGSLKVDGGVGIAKKLYVGTGVYTGNITIGGSSDVPSKSISSASTLYLNRATSTSIIFQYAGTNKIRIDTDNFFRPETNNTLQIGSSSYKWNAMYATTFYGALSGNASSATAIKVNSAATTKSWITGTSTTLGDSASTINADSLVYLTTTAGQMSATSYSVNDGAGTPAEKVRLQWNSTDSSLDFIFT